jgi:hypothetical protein
MRLYYANERGRGMVAILGEAGQEAHTVESNAYRGNEKDLAALVSEIENEFKPVETIRYDKVDELVSTYSQNLTAA